MRMRIQRQSDREAIPEPLAEPPAPAVRVSILTGVGTAIPASLWLPPSFLSPASQDPDPLLPTRFDYRLQIQTPCPAHDAADCTSSPLHGDSGGRVEEVVHLVYVFLRWAEVDPTQGAGAGDVEEPGVNAEGVEFVVAGEDAEFFAEGEVFGAD
jgi:hypothetical protein